MLSVKSCIMVTKLHLTAKQNPLGVFLYKICPVPPTNTLLCKNTLNEPESFPMKEPVLLRQKYKI